MKPLTTKEIIDSLKRLGVSSPLELRVCFREYLGYCLLRRIVCDKKRAKEHNVSRYNLL